MRVEITRVDGAQTIQAIKSVRAATGLSLKEARYVVDNVDAGRAQIVEVPTLADLASLDEGYTTYRVVVPDVALADFLEILCRYPRHLTVGDLADSLIVVLEPWCLELRDALRRKEEA